MFWFYTYTWQVSYGDRREVMSVFRGSFQNLVLEAAAQPESWVIIFAKEISEDEYGALLGEIG